MKRKNDDRPSVVSDLSCWGCAGIFLLGLLVLAVKLREVQVVDSSSYLYSNDRQSLRRVELPGVRGRIIDRHGKLLAGNRQSLSIAVNAKYFQKRSWNATVEAISNEINRVGEALNLKSRPSGQILKRHINQSLAMPLVVWRDVNHVTLARFLERERDFPGFTYLETMERVYPGGSLAAHILGYVGRDRTSADSGDTRFNFRLPELRGRAGIEQYYDEYLNGVPGEKRLRVDARGFTVDEWIIQEPKGGPDLQLTLDANLQRSVEKRLAGFKGACVAIDPRNGEVLAIASAPSYNLNDFVPYLSDATYERYSQDVAKPLLNRASGGAYAPGSTFKPITALAGLSIGYPADHLYCCNGVYELGNMELRCARRWGHGELDLRHALKESCNPFFCNLGVDVGTNALIRAAKAFGLGSKTGLDLSVDMSGTVPDAAWKAKMYHEKWFQGDVAQMSIGQGMLLVSPLQMARVAGAIGTGKLVTPHLRMGAPTSSKALPFSLAQLRVVREGMRMVVDGGTGKRGGEGVSVPVSGKTGTAEVGKGATRRKNTWFIAYAPSESPVIAIAMVIENGQSGGGTTAPRVAEILKEYFETL